MTQSDGRPRVLAVAIDAAEATFVRRLLAEGALPALAALLERGRWSRVQSSAAVGSGSVWPTFLTGLPPQAHGVYSEWRWDPLSMTLTPFDARSLTPFWSGLEAESVRVGLLDVPFAPFSDVAEGFELSEWGAHDVLEGRTRVAPAPVARMVETRERHPYSAGGVDVDGPDDRKGQRRVAEAALRGIRLRGDLAARLLADVDPHLAVVVFTEIHHASHLLWHTVGAEEPDPPTVRNLYQAVDRELGRLVGVVGDDASVMVFALHGMRPTRGIPTVLGPLLRAEGHARDATWRTRSWRERALAAFGAAKRRSPRWARAAYNRLAGHAVRVALARPTMMDALDWSRTRAFALPTDQHGWVRVNLQGREREGSVPVEQYGALCDSLESDVRGLADAGGRPLAAGVVRTAGVGHDADPSSNRLPDLVVHWADAAHAAGSPSLTTLRLTGQHSAVGFCVSSGAVADGVGDEVQGEALAAVLLRALGV